MSESAFIVTVPEAEVLVQSLRWQFDPVAKLGVPAHITVLYPFMSVELIDESMLLEVANVLTRSPWFTFALNRVGRFPGVTYLAPEPADPFIRLTQALVGRFPAYLPYGGRFGIVPHLTVGHGAEEELTSVQRELENALRSAGPIHSICRSIRLIENSSGIWRCVRAFSLAGDEKR